MTQVAHAYRDVQLLLDAAPCLVFNKPAGVLTQAAPGIPSYSDWVREYERERSNAPGDIYLGVPHRLDRPVSGAIVFTRNIRATRKLSDQFASRTVEKTYWVLVQGRVEPDRGTWCDWMRKIPEQAHAEILPPDHPEARKAILHYQVCRHDDFGSWLQVTLETGRMHQIRLQCASRGHPILGDEQYGSAHAFGPTVSDPRERWIGLHSRRLTFLHPQSQERRTVDAPLWQPWLEFRPSGYWVPVLGDVTGLGTTP